MSTLNYSLSISSVVESAWSLFKKHGSSILVILMVYTLISGSISFITTTLTGNTIILTLVFSVVKIVIDTLLLLGVYRVLLDVVDGKKPELTKLFSQTNFPRIIHSILGTTIVAILVLMGCVLLLFPGLYILFRLQFCSLIILEQEKPNFTDAIKESWLLTENHVLDLIGIGLVSFMIVLGGLLAFLLGLLVAIPLVSIVTAVVYRRLQSLKASALKEIHT